eukprot:165153-Chlamydomonas_euryale.AAC.3
MMTKISRVGQGNQLTAACMQNMGQCAISATAVGLHRPLCCMAQRRTTCMARPPQRATSQVGGFKEAAGPALVSQSAGASFGKRAAARLVPSTRGGRVAAMPRDKEEKKSKGARVSNRHASDAAAPGVFDWCPSPGEWRRRYWRRLTVLRAAFLRHTRPADKAEKKDKEKRESKVDKPDKEKKDKGEKDKKDKKSKDAAPGASSAPKPRPGPPRRPPPQAAADPDDYLAGMDLPSSDDSEDDHERSARAGEDQETPAVFGATVSETKKLADRERKAAERAYQIKKDALREDDNVFDVAFEGQGDENALTSAMDVKVRRGGGGSEGSGDASWRGLCGVTSHLSPG